MFMLIMSHELASRGLKPGYKTPNKEEIGNIQILKLSLLSAVLVVYLTTSALLGCPVGDLDGNCKVDGDDVRIFCDQWLNDPGGTANLDYTGPVNMNDFAILADHWLEDHSGTTLLINEFMTQNDTFIQDPCGDYDDWVEIYNYGSSPVDMGGMYLTDDVNDPMKWWIRNDNPSATTIDAYGYLLIWADDETGEGPLHASFKLSASGGEDVGLYDSDANVVDSITNFGPQEADDSYGRFPNGSGLYT